MNMLRHIAIIMDGNRRWARMNGQSTSAGHRCGADNIQCILQAISDRDISCTTLFAFSAENWQRGKSATDRLMRLAEQKLLELRAQCLLIDMRFEFIGRLDRLPDTLRQTARTLAEDTRGGHRCLRIALDYSARWAIWQAAQRLDRNASMRHFDNAIRAGSPPVDLLIRTGSEQRLSDFLLWECAFAELYFSPRMWPEFAVQDLHEALHWYEQRQRRFGA